jgi:hypothetical protein
MSLGTAAFLRFTLPLGCLAILGALAYGRLSHGQTPRGDGVGVAGAAKPGSIPAVLVELFSSEGCSSCPPADVLLRELDDARTVGGARVVALEFHVDYWDDLGWKDPFSREAWSDRQREYVGAGVGGMYTPGMIVDGREAFVGSDEGRARSALALAAKRAHVDVQLARTGSSLTVKIPNIEGPAASAWLAVSERGLETKVERGENEGKKLPHGPVVRSLERLEPDLSKGLERTVAIADGKNRLSFAVFVQRNESREVLVAAAL